MEATFKEKVMRWLTMAVVSVIVLGGFALVYPNYQRGQALKRQDADLQAQIDAKRREIAKLTEYKNRFRSDPDFVEAIARQNHKVFPGELIFIFNDD